MEWRGCERVAGCTCEGGDCQTLASSEDACVAEHESCVKVDEEPFQCAELEVYANGPCLRKHGWTRFDNECIPVQGCTCQGSGCGVLYESEETCNADPSGCGQQQGEKELCGDDDYPDFNSHAPMAGRYQRMLETFNSISQDDRLNLSAEQLRSILES